MKNPSWTLVACGAVMFAMSVTSAEAQTGRAIERRIDRNARQMQRQANQADYYTAQTWQQLDPWVREYNVAPLAKAARNVANAVGNAVAQAADAATPRVDTQFGYRNNTEANAWFYDYYTYTPTYYSWQSGDRYAGAIRYFDADNDGVYDSYSLYRDSDNDGRYDEYDRINFYANTQTRTSERSSSEGQSDNDYRGPEDARRHTVKGEISMAKSVEVNGDEHLMVGVKTEQADMMAVDLGPARAMKGRNVEVGQSIVAVGAMERVGEKEVLVAQAVQIGGGETVQISQSYGMTLTGEIVDVKNTTIGSGEHYIAIIEFDGQRQLVDLGPTTTYQVQLEPSTQITVRGIPVRAQDHRVIMAEQVQLGDEVIQVQRTQTFRF